MELVETAEDLDTADGTDERAGGPTLNWTAGSAERTRLGPSGQAASAGGVLRLPVARAWRRAVVTKLSDRGSSQTIGLVTDVGLFLHHLAQKLQDAPTA